MKNSQSKTEKEGKDQKQWSQIGFVSCLVLFNNAFAPLRQTIENEMHAHNWQHTQTRAFIRLL